MPPYSPMPEIFDLSLKELESILIWSGEREVRRNNQKIYLIGGWAVYGYNPTLKSVDIDLVTNSTTRSSVMHYLKEERGFRPESSEGFTMVLKPTPYGEIKIDFATTSSPSNFAGRLEQLSFRELETRFQAIRINDEIMANMPDRSLLLLFKSKASWDRSYRVRQGISGDPEWDHGKMVKDNADIIALLDPLYGGRDIDQDYLGRKFREYRFLTSHLKEVPEDIDAIGRYGKMNQREVKDIFNDIWRLLNI